MKKVHCEESSYGKRIEKRTALFCCRCSFPYLLVFLLFVWQVQLCLYSVGGCEMEKNGRSFSRSMNLNNIISRFPHDSYYIYILIIFLPVKGSETCFCSMCLNIFYIRYSTLLHLPPLRFHCVGEYWRTQDCCDFVIDSQTIYPFWTLICRSDPHLSLHHM
jgi:hypothetical protein